MRNINKKGIYTSIIDQLKLQEEYKIITQCKYHHWILRTISEWILIIRGWWVTVQNCARRKRTSIRCASNLPSLPWNITTKVHKIRTTLKRRSNIQACIGKPLPPQSGKVPTSSKAAAAAAAAAATAAAAAAAAILHRLHSRKRYIYSKKEIHREDRIWDYNSWMTDV